MMRAYTRPAPVPKMPDGLVELMDGMAREVLLKNPTNVYEFCANHMEKLLQIRDGPSSRKLLTVDQKILKAQEKVRQRAKERQERFDLELQLRSKTSNKDTAPDEVETPLILEDSVIPDLKAPVRHVHNLQDASEVEISQNLHKADPRLFLESSKAGKLNVVSEASPEIATENSYNAKNRYVETSGNNKSQDTISEHIEIIPDMKSEGAGYSGTTPDNKSDNEAISEKVETFPEMKPEGSIMSEKVGVETDKKPNDEQIFGKVEIETINVEPLKENETIDVFGVDTHLQTITEAANENSVSVSSSFLPKSSIADVNEPGIRAEETFEAKQLNVNNEVSKENSTERTGNEDVKNEMIPENSEFRASHCKELVPPKTITAVSGNIMPDSVNDIENDVISISSVNVIENDIISKSSVNDTENEIISKSSEPMTDETKHNHNSGVALYDGATISTSAKNNDSYENDVQQTKTSDDNSIVIADVVRNKDSQHSVIPIGVAQNFSELDDGLNKETTLDTGDEKQNVKLAAVPNKIFTEIENVTEITNIENKVTSYDTNIEEKNVANANEADEHVKTNDGNMSNENNQLHGNTDVLMNKSDSIDNANEDSISIIESDLSKTDDSQNNPNMDLETAAVTIQKVLRSFMFKSRNSTFEDNTNEEHNSLDEDNDKKEEYYAAAHLNKERRPLGITRMDTVLQTVNEEKSLSLSTDDSSTLSSAATTIQAHVRGFLVRNKLNSSKTFSMNSLVNSHEVLETDSEQQNKHNKTVLNIHIVPEEGNYLSRDESLITSMDLSLDGSPPSSVNLHPLSCDISERRKMLKREDAVQSVSPPSNNSGKLSEDSIKEVLINENGVLEREPTDDKTTEIEDQSKDFDTETTDVISSASTVTPTTIITISKSEDPIRSPREIADAALQRNERSFTKMSSDENDVITPFIPSPRSNDEGTKLVHSGEFHDVVLPTKVSRNDTSVVRGE